ncbi:MAG: hypothetical protein NTY99_01175, partial [DPANN group archaeon]|nr:hypothetical protein [DPANN group archaeon]
LPDLKKADYIHNAASLISVPAKLLPELKIGCIIYADDFSGLATNNEADLKGVGLTKIKERTWLKTRQVAAEEIEFFNSIIRALQRPPDTEKIRFMEKN